MTYINLKISVFHHPHMKQQRTVLIAYAQLKCMLEKNSSAVTGISSTSPSHWNAVFLKLFVTVMSLITMQLQFTDYAFIK